jgi:antitoxin component YwqK of YwqJK toxin-antitoxin module
LKDWLAFLNPLEENMAKEITLEEAKAEITALREQFNLLKDTPFQLQQALEENESLKAEVAELKLVSDKVSKKTNVVPGTYKSKAHKKTIRFKDGMVQTNVNGHLVDSAEVIKNKDGKYTEVLDFFIEVGAGVIEIVD